MWARETRQPGQVPCSSAALSQTVPTPPLTPSGQRSEQDTHLGPATAPLGGSGPLTGIPSSSCAGRRGAGPHWAVLLLVLRDSTCPSLETHMFLGTARARASAPGTQSTDHGLGRGPPCDCTPSTCPCSPQSLDLRVQATAPKNIRGGGHSSVPRGMAKAQERPVRSAPRKEPVPSCKEHGAGLPLQGLGDSHPPCF